MCGFNGFTFHDSDLLQRMHAATRHRGPDDQGFFEEASISFSHNRLSIIDLSEAGRQPMSTPDGRFTIVFNGEIYNFQELRGELEAHGEHFFTRTDTEVLVRVYAKWGREGLKKLNGVFAFAIWDKKEESLVLVRDPMGVKPLYYREDAGKLWFSSELKALVDVGRGKPDIHTKALQLYLRLLYIPAPYTIWEGIQKLPAGHLLEWRKGKSHVFQWWVLEEGEVPSSYAGACQEVYKRCQSAVMRQLISDRPVGVFLSGGLDSTILLTAMRQNLAGPIETYTVSYTSPVDEEKYNADALLARMTAEHFSTNHHEIQVTPADVEACFDQVVWHMDEPIANHVQPATYLLAKEARKRITVALGGDGGDELFGGYPRYWYQQKIERLHSIGLGYPAGLLALLVPGSKMGRYATLLGKGWGPERHLAFLLQKERDVHRLLRSAHQTDVCDALHEIFDVFFQKRWRDKVNQSMAIDLGTWLPDESLMRSDKMTMAHGLEQRVPLLDLDMVKYSSSIPSAWKLGTREQGKRILLDAWRHKIPPHVIRQEKRAFMSPAAKWIRGPLHSFMQERLAPRTHSSLDEVIDFGAAQRMLDEHVEKKQYHLHLLWALMTLRVWHDQYIGS